MELQYYLELIGTFFFAISGALAVKGTEHDYFGAGFMAFVTAIGGGSLRDIILGSYPLVWVKDVNVLYVIILGVITTRLFYKFLKHLSKTLLLFDTLGIALFTIVGTEKALSLGVSYEIAALMGMFTAVMGGVIRDILTNTNPIIFRQEIYASACLAGACSYIILDRIGLERNTNFLFSVSLITFIRICTVKYKLSLPRFL